MNLKELKANYRIRIQNLCEITNDEFEQRMNDLRTTLDRFKIEGVVFDNRDWILKGPDFRVTWNNHTLQDMSLQKLARLLCNNDVSDMWIVNTTKKEEMAFREIADLCDWVAIITGGQTIEWEEDDE